MDYDQLEKLVLESKDYSKLQRALSSLTQAERKALSAKAVKLKNQISRSSPNKDASDRLQKYLSKQNKEKAWNSKASYNATLALFAVGPISAIKKSDSYIPWDKKDVVTQIVLDRKPDWIDDWVAYDLDQEFSSITFPMVRKWILAGVCSKPTVDGYFKMLAWNLKSTRANTEHAHKPPLSDQLLAEPDMLDDVWRLFEIESQAFDDPSWMKSDAPDNYESWSDALIKLSASGILDRNRLLDASLSALLIDVKQNYLSGFHKFHKSMKPTSEELTIRQNSYLDLLCHKVGHVVKFSLSMMKLIEKRGSLNCEKFLSEVPVVFQHDAKGIAIDSIRLIKLVVKNKPSLLSKGLFSLLDALRHPNIDVQSMALDIFEDYRSELSGDITTELVSVADFVSMSMKSRVLKLIDDSDGVSETYVESIPESLEQLHKEFSSINAETKAALGITNLFNSEDFKYCSIESDIKRQSILQRKDLIEPIVDLDDLIASISHAVESVDSPDEVERVLDGISRLCNERPTDFVDRVAPLLHRLEVGGGLITKDGIASGDGGTRLAMADLILTWLTGKKYKSPNSSYFSSADALIPANTRIGNIKRRVIARKAQPLIAAPTHAGGWIDPLVWLERITHCEDHRISYDRIELCFSLLRLAPDNREEALKRAQTLSGNVSRLVNFVLGGSELPKNTDRKDYDIWISAARARDPYRDWSEVFAPLKLNDDWADSLRPAIYQWRAYQKEHSRTYNYGQGDKTERWKTPHLDLDVKVSSVDSSLETSGSMLSRIRSSFNTKMSTDTALMPAAALNRRKVIKYTWSADLNSVWLSDWLSYQWPLCPDAAFITGVRQLVARIDMDGSNWEPGFGFLYGLFQKNRPWREAGHLLVCIGLVGKDADARGLAIDALIAGVENGCTDIELLSETLVRLSNGEWLKLNRLGDNLLQVSQVSLLHAWVISELIQRWLLGVDIKQRYLFRMLEVLREAQFTIRLPLHLKTNEILKKFSGSTKAAKVARELLKEISVDTSIPLQLKKLVMDYRI